MKTKLFLNKVTVANLDNRAMGHLIGGYSSPCYKTGDDDTSYDTGTCTNPTVDGKGCIADNYPSEADVNGISN